MAIFASIVGGFIEGISISNILFGITVAQFYVYTQNWNRDPKWLKCLATLVILLEVAYTAFAQRGQYFYFVLAIGDPVLLIKIDWSIPAAVAVEFMTEIVVRGFYMYRMWIFSKNLALLVVSGLLLAYWAGIFSVSAIVDMIKSDAWIIYKEGRGYKGYFPGVISSLSLSILLDLLTAITMVYYLYRRQSQLTRAQGILGWLMLYFVSTGVVLAALAGNVLICFFASPNTLLWAGMITLYARSVSNCFFGALNARQVLRSKQGQIVTFGGGFVQNSNNPASVELRQVAHVQVSNNMMLSTGSNTTLDNGSPDIKPMDTLNIA
ncbi:hypothetical protein QCA50_014135 [Cerrena zonata]|uniref:DUF6534 domain-containing protein n=1 Tax=Cerrena zonata TaxID=2478898 RepID=A0AAW0FZM4_9APHY